MRESCCELEDGNTLEELEIVPGILVESLTAGQRLSAVPWIAPGTQVGEATESLCMLEELALVSGTTPLDFPSLLALAV